jgi:hypothetical protein
MAGNVSRPASAAWIILTAALSLSATCRSDPVSPAPNSRLAAGTWGGENSGLILDDMIGHVHVGCTYGDFTAPVTLDEARRFSVNGSYLLRAFPVAVGPTMPAQFAGVVAGGTLTLSVAVNDTIEKKLTLLGPVTLTFGKEPRMGPCPICRMPRLSMWSFDRSVVRESATAMSKPRPSLVFNTPLSMRPFVP